MSNLHQVSALAENMADGSASASVVKNTPLRGPVPHEHADIARPRTMGSVAFATFWFIFYTPFKFLWKHVAQTIDFGMFSSLSRGFLHVNKN